MAWTVVFHDEFLPEFRLLPEDVYDEILAAVHALAEFGPLLGRPMVDTLKGSKFKNMKEFRFYTANSVWRIAFAFDPERKAVLLVAGDKTGVNQRRFYTDLIQRADRRLARHFSNLRAKGKTS